VTSANVVGVCQSQKLWLAQMVGNQFHPTICFSA
jgi:hypothetical protein